MSKTISLNLCNFKQFKRYIFILLHVNTTFPVIWTMYFNGVLVHFNELTYL